MQTSEKPRARPYNYSNSYIAWVCNGYKGNLFHVRFGSTWWDACRQWHETEPSAPDFIDTDYLDDCPF